MEQDEVVGVDRVPGRELRRRSFLAGGAGMFALGAMAAGCGFSRGGLLGSLTHHGSGPTIDSSFRSRARGQDVAYTISYPPGSRVGDRLPLVLALHGYTGSHVTPIGPTRPADLLTSTFHGRTLPAMAIAAVDGGDNYWHRHPGDDPMAMLLDEFLPLCRKHGLGVGVSRKIGLTGVSMGGYGALLLAEQHPELVAAIAVISPAVWTSYDASQNANPTAFTSAADFAANNVITHAAALRGIPLRLASGQQDPFHPYLESLVPALPADSTVHFPPGAHDSDFFGSQALPSLAFLGRHLAPRA